MKPTLYAVCLILFVLLGCQKSSNHASSQGASQAVPLPTAAHNNATTFLYDKAAIEELRRSKDSAFRYASWSPLTDFDKERFKGLSYFPAQAHYCVTAQFEPFAEAGTVIVETSQPTDYRKMRRVGVLRFVLGKDSCQLTGYVDKDQTKQAQSRGGAVVMGVYFKDRTSGVSTYEAGRYLELPYVEGATTYTLDFNRAFTPYCAYNDSYACPLVPRENILSVTLEAGEKMYRKPF
jgi:hypothetical protein